MHEGNYLASVLTDIGCRRRQGVGIEDNHDGSDGERLALGCWARGCTHTHSAQYFHPFPKTRSLRIVSNCSKQWGLSLTQGLDSSHSLLLFERRGLICAPSGGRVIVQFVDWVAFHGNIFLVFE